MADSKKFNSGGSVEDKTVDGTEKKSRAKPLVILGSLILLVIVVVLLLGWWYVSVFSQASGVGVSELYDSISKGMSQQLPESGGRTNLLLLGLDENGQRNGSLLTDTMILVSIRGDGEVTMVSIPRDLWVSTFKTKINALYYYGELSDETGGEKLVRSVVEQITGLQIHYSLVTTLKSVSAIVDAVDYVNVEVENAFVDNKYPRDDVPPDIEPEELRYKTVQFDEGWQKFDGETALKFIRSRNSESESEGTDIGRSVRQQKVINAIVARMTTKEILKNPAIIGAMYRLWKGEIKTDLTDIEMVSMGKLMVTKGLQFRTISIPLEAEGVSGLIYHPSDRKYNQWVYEPVDPSWLELQRWFSKELE